MSTAELARKIRYELRKHHDAKLFWRSWLYRFPKQFERLYQLFLVVAICTVVSAAIVRFATWAPDPVETLLLVNAIGGIGCVFLIGRLRYFYDVNDFPRLNTIALLPWTDRQWLYEFLRGTVGSLIPPLCFSLITLCSAAMLPAFAGDYKIGLAITAAAVQVLMIASLALFITSFPFNLLRSPSLSLWFGRIKTVALFSVALLLYPPIAQQAVAWRLSNGIFLLPPAWPTAIFRASAGDLSIPEAFIGLFGFVVVAITILTISIVRLKRTFKVGEIFRGPIGYGFMICRDAWDAFHQSSEWIAIEAEQSMAPATQQCGPADSGEKASAADPETDDSSNDIIEPKALPYRNSLDAFWDNQGWLGRWFDADQKNIVAMQYLVFDSHRSPWQFYRYYTGLMVIVAVYFLIAPQYLPSTVAYAIPLMFASMAMGIFREATTAVAASYRSLPLLANQWLWPPIKYEFLRMAMLVPPGITLITAVMMVDGYDSSTILKTLSIAVLLPFIIQATLKLLTHTNETRDRIRFSTILAIVMFVIPVILAVIASVIGQFALDWPMNLWCVPITLIAFAVLWKSICYWQDKGSVDHYVVPKN